MLEEKSGDQIQGKRKRHKKERAPEKAESAENDQFDGKLDGRKAKNKKKKKNEKEEFRADVMNLTFGVSENVEESEIDMVEKKDSKRKRTSDGEDFRKKEKRRKRVGKGASAGLDEDVHDDEKSGASHGNFARKEKEKSLRNAGTIGLEESNKEENRDAKLEGREEEKYDVEKKKKRKRN